MARRALGPNTLAAVQAVDRALRPPDSGLLVACSGGADSLALAVATAEVARRRALSVAAVVVDHGLQAGSAEVAATTQRRLEGLGYLDIAVQRVVVADGGDGPEAAARTARYAALEASAETGRQTVLLGHTLDDQAETVLLALARGSGVRSLAGMAERTGRWLRPFLGLRRQVTLRVCAEVGLEPWQDPHNTDHAYARARVRDAVLPVLESGLGPGIAEALARTAELARDDADLLDRLAEEADPKTDTLRCADLAGLPRALRSRVLRRWLVRRGAVDLGYAHLVEVERLVTVWHGQRALDLPGVSVTREDGQLYCR